MIKHPGWGNLYKEVYFGLGYQTDKNLLWQAGVAASRRNWRANQRAGVFKHKKLLEAFNLNARLNHLNHFK